MVRIEKIKGLLKSVDDNSKILEIELDSVIHERRWDFENNMLDARRYHYKPELEWEDPAFSDHIGKRVECRLLDDVVDKIEPSA